MAILAPQPRRSRSAPESWARLRKIVRRLCARCSAMPAAAASSASPAQQCVADLQVLGHRDLDPPRVHVREVAQPRGVRPQLGDRAAQVLVAGRADDRPVEPVGQLVERAGTGLRRRPALDAQRTRSRSAANDAAQLRVGRRGLGRLPDRGRLEQRPEVEQVADALQRDPRHPGALARDEVDQPLGGQPAQRLADRRPGRAGALDQRAARTAACRAPARPARSPP